MARLSSLPTAQIDAEAFAFQQSSPLSLRQPCSSPPAPPLIDFTQGHDYNFSGAVSDALASGTESDDVQQIVEIAEEEEFSDTDRRISICSSISSFPASSISQHAPPRHENYGSPRTPTRQDSLPASRSVDRSGGYSQRMDSPRSAREYHSAFRHPSSVRALQMRDEAMSETQSVVRHHRRSHSQMSSYSQRSSFTTSTSPTKRSSRSHRASPQKPSSNLRKEFPLVLLHCTLLPPVLMPQSSAQDDAILSEFLPPEYKNRWETLKAKLVDDVEVRSRGILISHPREDYEVLEERLLETLELEQPRISHNHFFHRSSASGDSGFESESLNEEDLDCNIPKQTRCIDCGGQTGLDPHSRRWEVKVYAANGLMRSGAWGAAWQDMEKVDVEIRVWLPETVRRNLEAKLAELESSQAEPEVEILNPPGSIANQGIIPEGREREVYGASGRPRSQSEIDGFYEEPSKASNSPEASVPFHMGDEPNLQNLLLQSAQKFGQDRKNILVGVLSFLVLFFALVSNQQPTKENTPAPITGSTQSAGIHTTTVTSTAIAISTETVTASVFMDQNPHVSLPESTAPEVEMASSRVIHNSTSENPTGASSTLTADLIAALPAAESTISRPDS